ncbi:MAG: phytanoyl-CoA dioxygenase family protein [Thermoanaerobaculia bacterium]
MKSFIKRMLGLAPPPALPPLDERHMLPSDLWVDQPEAQARLDQMHRAGQVNDEEAGKLRQFLDLGYTTLAIELPEATTDAIEAEINRLWRERPGDVAYAYHSILKPFSFAVEATERKPSYRIADLHSRCRPAQSLFLHPAIYRYVRLILGEEPVATQSLYFEYGSHQALHRDPVFVQNKPAAHLVAAWIALEDIDPRSGPLVYVPGSHRLPYYEFGDHDHRFDHSRHTNDDVLAMADFDRKAFEQAGLQVEPFTPRRGEVLIWHHSLLHGGSLAEAPELTRKSFVIHFSSRAHYPLLKQTYIEQQADPATGKVQKNRVVETRKLLEQNGCAGFESPLAAWCDEGGGLAGAA